MPGQWLRTQVENGKTLDAQATQQTHTIDLPRSNFLGEVYGRIAAEFSGGTSPTVRIDITRVRVVANSSSVIVDLEGDQLAAIVKYEDGRAPSDDGAASSSPSVEHFSIPFGRGPRDEQVILPAKAFKSLQLELTFSITTSGSPSIDAVNFDMSADEYVSPDAPGDKLILRRTIVGSESMGNSEVYQQDIPLGNQLRAVYLHTDTEENIQGDAVKLLANGGSEIPFTQVEEQMEEFALDTYRFHDDSLPAAGEDRTEPVYIIPFDVGEDLSKLIDTSTLNDLKTRVKAAASGASGDVQVITEEVVAVE